MAWIYLGEFQLTYNWQFTKTVQGEIFRIKHRLINFDSEIKKSSIRGVLAQGFIEESNVNVFNPKLFSYRDEVEIFALYFPQGLNNHSFCFKRLDINVNNWFVTIEVFQGTNQQNLNNYLTTRFGETATKMALYPRLYSGSLDPESEEVKLVAGQIKKVVSTNFSRAGIKIITTGHSVLLTTGFNADKQPIAILDKIPPNYNFEKEASSAGIYQGEIWALCSEETFITVIEYSAK
jgi:hypothetical protein